MTQASLELKNLMFIRKAFLGTIKDLSVEQLNKIPKGFNNNVIWNFAHPICSTHSMCYGPSGNTLSIPQDLLDKYKNGSKPEGSVDEEEINYWKELAMSSVQQFEQDFDAQLFNNYNAWNLGKTFSIASIDDAMTFSYFHEGMHLGYIQAIKKSL